MKAFRGLSTITTTNKDNSTVDTIGSRLEGSYYMFTTAPQCEYLIIGISVLHYDSTQMHYSVATVSLPITQLFAQIEDNTFCGDTRSATFLHCLRLTGAIVTWSFFSLLWTYGNCTSLQQLIAGTIKWYGETQLNYDLWFKWWKWFEYTKYTNL